MSKKAVAAKKTSRLRDGPRERTLVHYCAVKRADAEGWTIVLIPEGAETAQGGLPAKSLLPDSRVELRRGSSQGVLDSIELLPFEGALDIVLGTGWAYDHEAQCWRAPNEPASPPSIGPLVDHLGVTFQAPDAGWLDTRFAAGAQSFECALSNVFDPLEAIVSWLERVAAGENERFCCDIEGSEIAFDLWPHARGLHLVIAHNTIVGRKEGINVVIPRESFVRSFYGALISFWEGPALVDNWREWASYTEAEGIEVDERDYELHPYPLRSPVLDRVVAAGSRSGDRGSLRP